MKLNSIIISSGVVLILITFGAAIVTYFSLSQIQLTQTHLEVQNTFELRTQQLKYHVTQIQQFLTDASLTKEKDSITEANENAETVESILNELIQTHSEMKSDFENVRAQAHQLTQVGLEMTAAYWKNGQEAGDLIMKRPETGLDAMSEKTGKALDALGKGAHEAQQLANQDLVRTIGSFRLLSLVTSIFAGLLSLFSFMVIYLRIVPLNQIANNLQDSSKILETMASKLNAGASDLKNANLEQSSATQQTASSLEQIRSMVSVTAENSERLQASSQKSQTLALGGKNGTDQVLNNLTQIQEETNFLVENIKSGNQDFKNIIGIISEIVSKTKVINEIVFQTKLLSFNASVEAARAGEYGKGFSVVAEEVGKLAQMSGQAAKEISEMLASSVGNVESIISKNNSKLESSIETSRKSINETVSAAQNCQQALNEIVKQVGEVGGISEELRNAINEQRLGLDQIGDAMSSLESATNKNVITSNHVAQVGSSVTESVDQLDEMVSDILSIVSGQSRDKQTKSNTEANDDFLNSSGNDGTRNSSSRLSA
jgi:methyl-accepting chemotaxis protein